jgi:hypothetical protein
VSTEGTVRDGEGRAKPSEVVGSYLSTMAMFAAVISIVWHPLRLVLFSLLIALIGAAMSGERRQRFAFTAVTICAASFFLGMVVAVVFKKPLW